VRAPPQVRQLVVVQVLRVPLPVRNHRVPLRAPLQVLLRVLQVALRVAHLQVLIQVPVVLGVQVALLNPVALLKVPQVVL